MKKRIFTGIGTAIVTPIEEDGINYGLFEKHIEWQIQEGINAIVVCGTTGEASTLTDEEHREAIRFAVEKSAGRVPIVAGTGSNDTAYAIDLTKFAGDAGADGVLVVTPYYNKTTQKGLVKMFSEIADISKIPLILYNVPSRTGISIEPKTCLALSEHPNISAIKEASGDISKIADTIAMCGDNLEVYSGNDDQIVPILSLGGIGCISVVSNIMPKMTTEICNLYFKGETKASAKLQLEMLPLIHALFCEVNPIPVKAACAAMGFCKNYLRSPLTEIEDAHYELLIGEMKKSGIIS
ncbi:MAG: 4-hydroxy-tetrahydrodipicolinate synthase [Eubacteriales bacterium]|nr:4-hydroxy-tetrahydrodipicolinate synthase [Eubacteriales bacterium]MDD4474664.1 4-hydroxy-tetrahydrodipicolinate synthase [Eubacteriales bacterium]